MNRPYHLRQADAGADFTGGSLSFAIVVVLVVKSICLKSSLINAVLTKGVRHDYEFSLACPHLWKRQAVAQALRFAP